MLDKFDLKEMLDDIARDEGNVSSSTPTLVTQDEIARLLQNSGGNNAGNSDGENRGNG